MMNIRYIFYTAAFLMLGIPKASISMERAPKRQKCSHDEIQLIAHVSGQGLREKATYAVATQLVNILQSAPSFSQALTRIRETILRHIPNELYPLIQKALFDLVKNPIHHLYLSANPYPIYTDSARLVKNNEIADSVRWIPMSFHPTKKLAAYAPADENGIALINLEDESSDCGYNKMVLHTEVGVTALAFNRTKNLLASGEENGSIWIWDLDKEEATRVQEPKEEQCCIVALSFDQTGRFLACADEDGSVQIADLEKNCELQELCTYPFSPIYLDFTPDNLLVTHSAGALGNPNPIRIWDGNNDFTLKKEIQYNNECYSFHLSPLGTFVITESCNVLAINTITDNKPEKVIDVGIHPYISFNAAETMCAIAHGGDDNEAEIQEEGGLSILDVHENFRLQDTLNIQDRLNRSSQQAVFSCTFNPTETFLACGGKGFIWVFDTKTRKLILVLPTRRENGSSTSKISFHSSGTCMMSCNTDFGYDDEEDYYISIWKLPSHNDLSIEQILFILSVYKAMNPSGQDLFSVGFDWREYLHDLLSHKVLQTFTNPNLLQDQTITLMRCNYLRNILGPSLLGKIRGLLEKQNKMWDFHKLP